MNSKGHSRSRLKTFASVLAMLPALGLAASTGNALSLPVPAERDDTASCAALAGVTIAPNTVIQSAAFKPDGDTVSTTVATAKIAAPFCRVIGVATPTADSHIGFEVWLPPASSWNGKFRGEGSGGSAGAISPGPMGDALRMGYATMSTDNGHLVDPNDPIGGSGQSWAYKHPEKMIDWGWRALHLSTVAAKEAIRRFYGKPPAKSYFVACSAGGHHAIAEATRFPADYDGMVAGAAPWQWTGLMFGHTWNSIPALKDPAAITRESAAFLNKAMVSACDRLDGVEDGIIADPRRCTVDPVVFQCTAGSNPGACLTPVQVAAARHVYAGATRSDGTRLFPGQVRGTELGWVPLMTGATPGGSSWDYWRLSVFQEPNFRNADFDFDRDAQRALATRVSGETLGEVYDSAPDLSAFKARGGRMILFQGTADYQITPLDDIDFYGRIVARHGQAATDSFLRFFLLPGMGHCSGGVGFSHIGGATGAPVSDDAGHDMVRALDAWVIRKRAPASFIAAQMSQDKQVTATRPVCMYPREAKYQGSGDTRDAANFTCVAPAAP